LVGQTAAGSAARPEAIGDPQIVVVGDQTGLTGTGAAETSVLQQISDPQTFQTNVGRDENLVNDILLGDAAALQMNMGNQRGDDLLPGLAGLGAPLAMADASMGKKTNNAGKDNHL
jgi:hypothetical protein